MATGPNRRLPPPQSSGDTAIAHRTKGSAPSEACFSPVYEGHISDPKAVCTHVSIVYLRTEPTRIEHARGLSASNSVLRLQARGLGVADESEPGLQRRGRTSQAVCLRSAGFAEPTRPPEREAERAEGGGARTTRCTSREHATHACRRHASPTREPRPAPSGCASTALTQRHRLRPLLSLLSQAYLSFGQGGHRACAEDRGRVEARVLPRGQRRKVADTRQ